MKWSKYNHITRSSKHGIFIFNSVTNSFIKIDPELLEKIEAVENWSAGLKKFEDDFVKVLLAHRIIVPEDFDSEVFLQKKYLKYMSSIKTSEVGLTIATTTGCNFKCPYCYEEGVKSINMSQDVEDAIVKYIETVKKPIDITWYGGEPLINWATIQRLTQKISEIKPKEMVKYALITNGYSLTPEKCDYFAHVNLKHIQITLDGIENTHNKSRISKNGKPSYQKIMDNIDYALKTLPNTYIAIRVNIGAHNKDDYPILRKEIYSRWGEYRKNLGMHFAFIIDYKCNNSLCLTTRQQMAYVRELYEKHMIITRNIFPVNNSGVCCANKIDSFVIAPDGILYKCWVDIGKEEKKIGTIFEPDNISNFGLLSEYFGDDKFSNPKCMKCFLLPLCGGLCPAAKKVTPKNNQCPYDSKYIDSILEILYEIMHSAQDSDSALVKAGKVMLMNNL